MGGLVILDLDDTLLRTAAATRAARRLVADRVFPGAADRVLPIWRRVTLLYPDQQFDDLLSVVAALLGTRLPPDLDLRELAAGYQAAALARITARPRVVAAARRLRDVGGHDLAIVSNGDDAVQRTKIERCGLGDLAPAERVVICDGVRIPRKPHPQAVHAVLTGAPAVLVGDRTTDVLCARRAGIPVVRLRARTADLERGAGLRAIARPDALCSAAELYEVTRELLEERG
ncbi:putative HAD-hydrolase [Actinoplanes sp. SE50]|uniref:HAD family hydrolase n=1 Tax=unclassified Actinoplanes TaxID=2626549 RepID=UPI00023ED1E8|nr:MULTISPECIES: HAD-IA family hydrolase [unclassified Actinoplanes]AEV83308.1 putative HAD-hydrolase [Actinoplanes sp. SE50/110]ATO81701.1 putative HAD-hydrolase [Actinoplanes sp. SE50]SLL99109.1 haloacid dehalogenase [Actinoplanes sp. SE50/110]